MKSDIELASEFQRGDRTAFHKLFRRHHLGLLNFFYWLMGSHRKAEELTELVFLRVFADRERLRIVPAFKFSVYLYRVGYTLWFGISGRHVVPATEEKSGNEDLVSALQSLPVELRSVLVLSEIIGLPYSDTAHVMDLNESDVRRRMNDAYAHLRLSMPAGAADLNASGQASGCSLGVTPPLN